ncbi:MAG TPA: DUF308 domain-containing protein [Chloroflexota bacterium]|nr:DUF308 domain-containing protein [Chloroflexota bacterium]
MATTVSPGRSSWVIAAQAIVAILFGLAVIFWQHLTLRVLLSLLGAYVLVAGALAIIRALRAAERHASWWRQALEGVVGIIVGGLVFLAPVVVATVLLYLIALWALITGISQIAVGLDHRDWLTSASGAVLLLFAIVVVIFAGIGILEAAWLIGLFAIVYGALQLAQLSSPQRPAA